MGEEEDEQLYARIVEKENSQLVHHAPKEMAVTERRGQNLFFQGYPERVRSTCFCNVGTFGHPSRGGTSPPLPVEVVV